MLPWEHVAVAYVVYSLFARIVYRRAPRGDAAVAIVLVALLPDLIDKPLAWGLGVLPSGRSLAHSLFFVVPTVAVAAATFGRRLGIAVALCYLCHLGADVVYPMALGLPPAYRFLLWPAIEQPATGAPGLFLHTRHVLMGFLAFLETTRGQIYVLFEVGLLGTAFVLWLVDGRPGPAAIRAWLLPAREPQGS